MSLQHAMHILYWVGFGIVALSVLCFIWIGDGGREY